ncbi:uncharacterized protein EV420DRAFT_1140296 [Desarmillaria tabescens]|uniref:DUF6533 domain-containing protein n=1 Tax=Armillaria tabescens TaxID=1929756 RepID=A0AA39NC18_ARMTA|nr:uncharacterized protein EV420DRAFT_1140296 [Desarmillaria tabescens]KAK0462834.1 hypothetical protein EV420DRAFT_1140296 [Desarmillaria tabescens]
MSLTASPTSYSFTACVTVILYDLLLFLPTEIDYVWLSRPVHPLLLLFALNRYLPLVDMAITINWLLHEPAATQCHLLAFIMGPFAVIGIFTSQVILMIRTYAIWDRHRAVFWCFIGTGVFCFLPGVVCLVIQLKTMQCRLLVIRAFEARRELRALFVVIETSSNYPGCFSVPSIMAKAFYIPVVVSETIIASLTFFRGIQHLRRSSHPFLIEFYVSGMFFYVCLLFMALANILVSTWTDSITPFLSYFQRILHSILTSRIMLIILKQRRIHRRYLDEEPYTADVELSHTTP